MDSSPHLILGRLGFQPIERVAIYKFAIVESVVLCILARLFDRLLALINCGHARSLNPRRMQGESSLKGEAIQHLRLRVARDGVSHRLIIRLLI